MRYATAWSPYPGNVQILAREQNPLGGAEKNVGSQPAVLCEGEGEGEKLGSRLHIGD